MAQKIQTLFIDDIDGMVKPRSTIRFALDGTSYEIDLSTRARPGTAPHSPPMSTQPGPEPGTRRPARPRRKPGQGSPDSTHVRDWAKKPRASTSKNRGRMPAELIVKFKAATTHSKTTSPPPARQSPESTPPTHHTDRTPILCGSEPALVTPPHLIVVVAVTPLDQDDHR